MTYYLVQNIYIYIIVLIVRTLYGLKSADNSWRQHLSSRLREELNYFSYQADQDVYIKDNIKPNGEKYWYYTIVYVDDILCIHHDPKISMKQISNIYRMKDGSISTPKVYLGIHIKEWSL